MKISKLHIDQFRHLENLDFDFTYQSGERKGEILDKICFIGQSATGKTSLLDLIFDCSKQALNSQVIQDKYLMGHEILNGEIQFKINSDFYIHKQDTVTFKNKLYTIANASGSIYPIVPYEDRKATIYFKSNLISDKNIDIFTENPIDIFEKYNQLTSIKLENLLEPHEYTTLFDDNVKPEMWILLLQEILEYRKKFNQKMSELIHKGLLANPKKLSLEFENWQKDNPNKLKSFAEKFNPIIEKLNLEIDLVNTEFTIPILNKRTEETIPIQNTSTGTKGLLLSFLPLFKLHTKDSIILLDEPERSLYPDMQMDLIDNYKKLASEAQYIIATHSPFVAASFEPDERFILYFDKEGKVAVRRGSSPIGDDPNDMLYNDFGINYINKYGQQKHQEYLDLKQKIHFENDPKKKEEISEQLEKLGEEYNF
ncbi:ATP-dependent endonuclease [Flavobacterium sp. LC2016-12]|jgi:hypothetical protein|uniref:ATP-dependent nuclease n=1 Tax=Flavobacterium sp. LC2016-12 TaxID=2783794 RepID=UPI001889E821|nr:AAA family ATPase [Flavobacterium sp. LC2016-12]MBF4465768.1 AAA family ATPase [Flavobacterium sp. LC2016-12]